MGKHNSNIGSEAPVGGTDEVSCLNYCSGYRFCSFDFGTWKGSRCCARSESCSSSAITSDDRAYRIYEYVESPTTAPTSPPTESPTSIPTTTPTETAITAAPTTSPTLA